MRWQILQLDHHKKVWVTFNVWSFQITTQAMWTDFEFEFLWCGLTKVYRVFCYSSSVLCKGLYQYSGPSVISYLTIYFIAFNELYIFVITFCPQLYLLNLSSILDTNIKSLHLTFSHNLNKSPFCLFAMQILYSSTCSQLNNTNLISMDQRTRAAIKCLTFLFLTTIILPTPFSFTNTLFLLTEYVSKLWYLHFFTELFLKIV